MTRRPRDIDVAGLLGVCFVGVFLVVSEVSIQLDWAPQQWSTPNFPEIGSAILGAVAAAVVTGLLALVLRARRLRVAAGRDRGSHGHPVAGRRV